MKNQAFHYSTLNIPVADGILFASITGEMPLRLSSRVQLIVSNSLVSSNAGISLDRTSTRLSLPLPQQVSPFNEQLTGYEYTSQHSTCKHLSSGKTVVADVSKVNPFIAVSVQVQHSVRLMSAIDTGQKLQFLSLYLDSTLHSIHTRCGNQLQCRNKSRKLHDNAMIMINDTDGCRLATSALQLYRVFV